MTDKAVRGVRMTTRETHQERRARLRAELLGELRVQADDEINRSEWDGAAANAYENALALVETYLPRIESATFRAGAALAIQPDAKS